MGRAKNVTPNKPYYLTDSLDIDCSNFVGTDIYIYTYIKGSKKNAKHLKRQVYTF